VEMDKAEKSRETEALETVPAILRNLLILLKV